MRRMPGVCIGIVENLEDPRGEGRVQISFPWLPKVTEKPWAPVAVPFAGKERGAFFYPEPDDEVLVAFEHGDFDHPFIIGFLWNGKQKPPREDINFSVRRLRTVSGHVLEFDDNAGEESISIRTQGGHEIEMNDSGPVQILIRTKGKQEIKLDDDNTTITLKTGEETITMTPGSVAISSSKDVSIEGKDINIKGDTITIEAASKLKAKGSPIHLNPP